MVKVKWKSLCVLSYIPMKCIRLILSMYRASTVLEIKSLTQYYIFIVAYCRVLLPGSLMSLTAIHFVFQLCHGFNICVNMNTSGSLRDWFYRPFWYKQPHEIGGDGHWFLTSLHCCYEQYLQLGGDWVWLPLHWNCASVLWGCKVVFTVCLKWNWNINHISGSASPLANVSGSMVLELWKTDSREKWLIF